MVIVYITTLPLATRASDTHHNECHVALGYSAGPTDLNSFIEGLSDAKKSTALEEGEAIATQLLTAITAGQQIDLFETVTNIGNEAEEIIRRLSNNEMLGHTLEQFKIVSSELNDEVAKNLDGLLDLLRNFQNGRRTLIQRTLYEKIPFFGARIVENIRSRLVTAQAAINEVISSLNEHQSKLQENTNNLKSAISEIISTLESLEGSLLVSKTVQVALREQLLQVYQNNPYNFTPVQIDQFENAHDIANRRIEYLSELRVTYIRYLHVFRIQINHNQQGMQSISRTLSVSVPQISLAILAESSAADLSRTLAARKAIDRFASIKINETARIIGAQGHALRMSDKERSHSDINFDDLTNVLVRELQEQRHHFISMNDLYNRKEGEN